MLVDFLWYMYPGKKKKHGSSSSSNKAFIQLRGEPCGGVWGVPIDVDASSRAIWVVCSKEPLGLKPCRWLKFSAEPMGQLYTLED